MTDKISDMSIKIENNEGQVTAIIDPETGKFVGGGKEGLETTNILAQVAATVLNKRPEKITLEDIRLLYSSDQCS